MYAILQHGGRQYRVSAGDRLVVDRLEAAVGTMLALQPVLLTGGDGATSVKAADLDGVRVAATVVSHRRGPKLRVFKYKAKKRVRRAAGHRSDLTELRVEDILAKGAALPAGTQLSEPASTSRGRAASTSAPGRAPARGRARSTAREQRRSAPPPPADAAAETMGAATAVGDAADAAEAATTTPKRTSRRPSSRAPQEAPSQPASAEGTSSTPRAPRRRGGRTQREDGDGS